MLRYLTVLGLALTMISCGATKVGSSKESDAIVLGKTEVVNYHSLGNGVADISLKLYENNTFLFEMESIPQPDTRDKSLQISEKGTYTSEGKWKLLKFQKPKFSLEALFDSQFSQGNDFKVINKESVKINTESSIIAIWGVNCEKK